MSLVKYLWVGGFMGAALVAQAQTYPVRPVHVIVPQPPGGGFDTGARALAAFERQGLRMLDLSPQQAEVLVSRDIEKWAKLIRDAGIHAD
jgi:tripartite-type tricarboxylate transporter receptor subunit TctC